MRSKHPYWPKHSMRFFGGGGGSGIASAPIPTPAPPVTADDPSVIAAEHDLAKQNLLKKTVNKTILAGDTGGYMPGGVNTAGQTSPPTSYKSKLG